jgi:hypothetical protein
MCGAYPVIIQSLALSNVKNDNSCDLKLDKTLHGEIRGRRESTRTLFFGVDFFPCNYKLITYF